ncbi:hypothetical protein RHMOL_Rhmol09G0118300 [Rhododendron molle]|uniref:Uncharacterized protein n=1 Tax=Rhododendron molle TaxID=49168 RepID=A0ACC0MCR0_RHOML|nr:hypothetical protein RHMOL_Rhmol09G0118300 [Rhododendron molle]
MAIRDRLTAVHDRFVRDRLPCLTDSTIMLLCKYGLHILPLNDLDMAFQLHHVSSVEEFDMEGSSEVSELHRHSVIVVIL